MKPAYVSKSTESPFPGIEGSDASSDSVIERMGGTLPKGNAIAISAGVEGLAALSGFEKEGFSYRHCIEDVWAFVVLVSGEGSVECKGRTYQLKPGTVYAIPPGIPFHERNTGDCAWGFACLLIRFAKASDVAVPPQSGATVFSGGFDVAGKAMEVVKALHFRQPGFELRALGGTLMILGSVAERIGTCAEESRSQSISRAISILKQRTRNPPGVPQLAKLCNVSVSLLTHQFKRETGFSPMQYIRRERVKAAKELILSGCNIEEAATRLGFKTPFHFSRLFSQIEGKPPIYFRKLANRTSKT